MNDERHARDLMVWDVPSAVECGSAFAIKLGAKCDGPCTPAAWPVAVRDHEGGLMADGVIAGASWPATQGLFYTELELCAPAAAGLYAWHAELPAVPAGAPDAPAHATCRVRFNIQAVPAADCRLTVIAVDRISRAPVPGLTVVVHPYRSLTDDGGVAELNLPRGRYRLFVSGKDFLPFRSDAEIREDMTVRAELELDAGPTDAELWS